MKSKKQISHLKKRLAAKDQEIEALKQELKGLQSKTQLQKAVLDTLEEVNGHLAQDAQGKQLLWTTNFPHNLPRELAEKVQSAVKKSPLSGAIKNN